jgi:rhodanese-related sulfurtransferase
MATLRPLSDLIADLRSQLRCLEAAACIDEIRATGGLMIDVRETGEAAAEPTPHSVNLPRGILEMKVTDLAGDPEHPIYLHCATGGRATLAAEQLTRLGYTRVTVMTCPVAQVIEAQRQL